jgi:hypothetical protein
MQMQITRARVIEFRPPDQKNDQESNQEKQLESNIEARLLELKNFAEEFSEATFIFSLSEDASVREAIEELLVKETALRWIIAVAKRSTGRARIDLWADIDRVLTGLENTVAGVIHAEEKRLIRI